MPTAGERGRHGSRGGDGGAAADPEPQGPGGRQVLHDVEEPQRVTRCRCNLFDGQRQGVVAGWQHDGGVPAVLDFDLR